MYSHWNNCLSFTYLVDKITIATYQFSVEILTPPLLYPDISRRIFRIFPDISGYFYHFQLLIFQNQFCFRGSKIHWINIKQGIANTHFWHKRVKWFFRPTGNQPNAIPHKVKYMNAVPYRTEIFSRKRRFLVSYLITKNKSIKMNNINVQYTIRCGQ